MVGINGPLKGRVFDRREKTVIVGRDKGRWRFGLDDEYVSQTHARLFWDPDKKIWMIRDTHSSNGTFLNLIEVEGDKGKKFKAIFDLLFT